MIRGFSSGCRWCAWKSLLAGSYSPTARRCCTRPSSASAWSPSRVGCPGPACSLRRSANGTSSGSGSRRPVTRSATRWAASARPSDEVVSACGVCRSRQRRGKPRAGAGSLGVEARQARRALLAGRRYRRFRATPRPGAHRFDEPAIRRGESPGRQRHRRRPGRGDRSARWLHVPCGRECIDRDQSGVQHETRLQRRDRPCPGGARRHGGQRVDRESRHRHQGHRRLGRASEEAAGGARLRLGGHRHLPLSRSADDRRGGEREIPSRALQRDRTGVPGPARGPAPVHVHRSRFIDPVCERGPAESTGRRQEDPAAAGHSHIRGSRVALDRVADVVLRDGPERRVAGRVAEDGCRGHKGFEDAGAAPGAAGPGAGFRYAGRVRGGSRQGARPLGFVRQTQRHHRRSVSRRWLLVFCAVLGSATAAESAQGVPSLAELEAAGATIGEIRIDTRNIFDLDDPKEDNALFRLANRLHIVTDPGVIRRALPFKSGERLSVRVLEEAERLLRGNRFLYEVDIRPVAWHDGVVDLEVATRDTWTLNPNVSFSRSGGVNKSSVSLTEYNLLGHGLRLGFSHSSDVDRTSTDFSISQDHAWDGATSVSYMVANLSDGRRQSFSLARPFYALDTRRALGVSASQNDRIDSVYTNGSTVAQFRHDTDNAEVFAGCSAGNIASFTHRYSLGVSWQSDAYRPDPTLAAPALLPAGQKLSAPFVRYEGIEDKFRKGKNRDLIQRPE